MAQETLSSIEEQEGAKRQRAYRYEQLVGEKITLEGTIRVLGKDTRNTDALEKMLALVPEVSADLSTRSGFGYPGGYDVRTMLTSVLSTALNDVQRRCGQRDEQLRQAREKLVKVEQQLTEFSMD
jgi:hypothetical protein